MGLENTASVELSKVKRAKKNALGKSIDTICGYVEQLSAFHQTVLLRLS
jgi:spore germination cell wall hydrolase CwlJ-like protein